MDNHATDGARFAGYSGLNRDADALHRLALDEYRRGNLAGAVGMLEQAAELAPADAAVRCDLGAALGAMGRHSEAVGHFQAAVKLRPEFAGGWRNWGVALEKSGRLEEAVGAYARAIGLEPGDAWGHVFMGNALGSLGREAEAAAAYERAIALNRDCAEAHAGLGMLRYRRGELAGAAEALAHAAELSPGDGRVCRHLADCNAQIGDVDALIAGLRAHLAANPKAHQVHSALLYAMHYGGEYGPPSIHAEHVEWARRHAEGSAVGVQSSGVGDWGFEKHVENFQKPRGTGYQPVFWSCKHGLVARATSKSKPSIDDHADVGHDRKLRIGYVSPDFRAHTVTRFILAAIEHHDRGRFEVFCYSNSRREDEITRRLKQSIDGWRDISKLGDSQAARMIREDRIDILIDLRGHGPGNRLLLFAQKPAPVQATMIGYFDTTGLAAMDYRITDEHQDPPGISERCHTETLVRLPQSAWCYCPYGPWPDVDDLPATKAGHVTFGSLNKIIKIGPACCRLWASVLEAVPNSQLLLAGGGADSLPLIAERLGGWGLPMDRVDLLPRSAGRLEYLARFNRIDVSLDTFPFNGITTTCESLWMGVPVVSLSGATSVSRVGSSILNAIGLPELATASEGEYLASAVALANDLPHLRELRLGLREPGQAREPAPTSLRERMRQSPLMDGPGYAARLEDAFCRMRSGFT